MMFLYNLNTGLQQITGSLGISIHKGRVLVIDFIIVKYIYKNYINIQIIICQPLNETNFVMFNKTYD